VSTATPALITLLSRPGCHLCDDAREVISRVAADLGVAWEERDITRSERDLLDYSDMIPVTMINGVQHDFWRVSENRLRTALALLARGSTPPPRGQAPGPQGPEPPGAPPTSPSPFTAPGRQVGRPRRAG
jgi:glutaredoxin-like protein DUF836